MIRLAACQYAIELLETWDAYAAHLTELCEEAAAEGSQLLLLPEYAGLVLSGQLPPAARSDLLHRRYPAVAARLARPLRGPGATAAALPATRFAPRAG